MYLSRVSMLSVQVTLAVMLLLLCVVIAAWEVMCYASGKSEYTISTIVGYWSSEVPILPLAVGIVIGHLFWPRTPWTPPPSQLILPSLLLLAAGVISQLCSGWRYCQPAIRSLWTFARCMPSGYWTTITSWYPLAILPLACASLLRVRRGRVSTPSCQVYRRFLLRAAKRYGDG